MLEKKGSAAGPSAPAARLKAWLSALEQAQADLSDAEFPRAERRAKAVSAVVRAAAEIEEWAKAAALEGDDDPEAGRRAFEIRIDRVRSALGLAPVFGGGES